MGRNTSDIEVRPHRDGARTLTMDANAQASLPVVDVMLTSARGDQLAIPQIYLSILGCEPNSLRDSHKISIYESPGNFNYATVGWDSISSKERSYWKKYKKDSSLVGQGYSQGGTYV